MNAATPESPALALYTHRRQMGNTEIAMVHIVDDDEPFRDGLSRLLRSVGLRTALYDTPEAFVTSHRPLVPSCLVLDVRLRTRNGLALHEEFMKLGLNMPVIFVTGYGDIEMSVKAMKAGAHDFLPKPFREQDMLDAVSHAIEKDRERLAREHELADLRNRYESLTAREKQVLGFVLGGLMSKQIATEIHLSEITVKQHRGQIMKKMDARSIAELVLMTASLGIQPTR